MQFSAASNYIQTFFSNIHPLFLFTSYCFFQKRVGILRYSIILLIKTIFSHLPRSPLTAGSVFTGLLLGASTYSNPKFYRLVGFFLKTWTQMLRSTQTASRSRGNSLTASGAACRPDSLNFR